MSAPFPFRLRLHLDGEPLDLPGPHWREHRRVLDLRRGVLHARDVYEAETDRRTVVRTRRCASLDDLHLLLQEAAVCLENHSGAVEVDASLAGGGHSGQTSNSMGTLTTTTRISSSKAEAPVIAEAKAGRPEDQGVVLMSDGRQEAQEATSFFSSSRTSAGTSSRTSPSGTSHGRSGPARPARWLRPDPGPRNR